MNGKYTEDAVKILTDQVIQQGLDIRELKERIIKLEGDTQTDNRYEEDNRIRRPKSTAPSVTDTRTEGTNNKIRSLSS